MAKFDVYRSEPGYLLDCQSDVLSGLTTRFVVPLLPLAYAPKPAAKLNPVFIIENEQCSMVTQFASAMPVRRLGEAVVSLTDESTAITNALDMLISGY